MYNTVRRRLWYQSLVPINIDWQGLKNLFRQQYSKIGNTREQLFHAWKSFSFEENTRDHRCICSTCIRQVAALIDYGEPQILEVFKNTLPTKLYWILFPIEDLRQAEIGTGLEKKSFSRNFSGDRNRSTSNSRSRSGARASMNRERIRCYKCTEYDHFTKDCPTSREERELEHLPQMLNLEDEQTSVKALVTNKQANFNRVNSEENLILGCLNL